MNYFNFKKLISIAIPLTITISLAIFLQNVVINKPDEIKSWLESFGILTIFVYIIFQSVTIIIAPIGGFAAAIAIIAIFGPFWGSLIIYLVTSPLYIINFLIARKYGRRVVKKLIGIDGLKIVDKYTGKITTDILILIRIFLGGYFDYISYGVGLTNIPFKTFVLINYLFAIPNVILTYLIFRHAPSFSVAVSLALVTPLLLGGIYLPFHKKIKKYFMNQNPVSREV